MAENHKIAVDLSKSRLTDWVLVSGAQDGKMNMSTLPAWIEFLDRVLVGGAEKYSMDQLTDVIKAVADSLGDMANPKAPAA